MITCKVLRDAFFGQHRELVYAAIPDLPEDVFGACRLRPLVPYAEQAGILPAEDLVAPDAGPLRAVIGISHEQQPHMGQWMEHTEYLGELHPECSIKEHVLGNCMIKGNRYGCAWFIRFLD